MAGETRTAGTFDLESSLPRLPVPDLDDSCARFLDWVAPLLDEAQQEATRAAVEQFRGPQCEGRALQERLLAHDATPGRDTWADRFFHERYFGRRVPVAINANYFFLFADAPGLGQLERAARLIEAAVQFKISVDRETLAPTQQRGVPLSMHQYRFLFSATRIPGDPMDTSRSPYTDDWPGPSAERHVLVLHRGHLLEVEVIDADGVPFGVDELTEGLRRAVALGSGAGPGVGALTSTDRPRWTRNRQALLAAGNADGLDAVERALFCVSLEDGSPDDATEACDRLLHGDVSARWFDKALTFVVFADGTAGFNGEHCRLDGTTVIGLLDAVLTATPTQTSSGRDPAVRAIEFTVPDQVHREIAAAAEDFAEFADDTLGRALSVDFDATRAKALGVSPDAFAQMAFQVTDRRTTDRPGSTYESIATTGFRLGRTEAMRVVTPQSEALCRILTSPDADQDQRRAALREAAQAHVDRARACRSGQAPEQHLWELQMIHQRTGATAPIALFDSPGWTVLRDERVSTSAVPSPHVDYWGFGPTGPDCLGIGYALLPDRFHLYLSARRSARARLDAFARELPIVVAELKALLDEH